MRLRLPSVQGGGSNCYGDVVRSASERDGPSNSSAQSDEMAPRSWIRAVACEAYNWAGSCRRAEGWYAAVDRAFCTLWSPWHWPRARRGRRRRHPPEALLGSPHSTARKRNRFSGPSSRASAATPSTAQVVGLPRSLERFASGAIPNTSRGSCSTRSGPCRGPSCRTRPCRERGVRSSCDTWAAKCPRVWTIGRSSLRPLRRRWVPSPHHPATPAGRPSTPDSAPGATARRDGATDLTRNHSRCHRRATRRARPCRRAPTTRSTTPSRAAARS